MTKDLRAIYEILLEKDTDGLSEQIDLEELFGAMETIDDVKIILVGQDSYPDPEKITAMAFSYRQGQKPTGSVKEIILAALKGKDFHDDGYLDMMTSGYLGTWRDQGVLLLNSDGPCVHALIKAIVKGSDGRVCGILLGNDASKLAPLFEVSFFWNHPSRKSTINNDPADPRHWNHTDIFWRANDHVLESERMPINWATVTGHNSLFVFTDGGFGKNKKEGSSAYAIFSSLRSHLGSNVVRSTKLSTNNIAELMAIINVLKIVREYKMGSINIISDSKYCINSITIWYNNWLLDPEAMKTKKNTKLLGQAVALTEAINSNKQVLTYKHQHGHTTEPDDADSKKWFLWYGNDFVDKMAGY